MHMVPLYEVPKTGKPIEPEDSWLLGPGAAGWGRGELGWREESVLKLDRGDGHCDCIQCA